MPSIIFALGSENNSFNNIKGNVSTITPNINNMPANTNGKLAKAITATILAFSGILGSTKLLKDQSISECSFIILILLSIFTGLLIAFIDRVKAFNMRELKVTLYEIKDTERNIKELALATADLVESVSDAAIMTEDFNEDRFKAALKKVREMEEA